MAGLFLGLEFLGWDAQKPVVTRGKFACRSVVAGARSETGAVRQRRSAVPNHGIATEESNFIS